MKPDLIAGVMFKEEKEDMFTYTVLGGDENHGYAENVGITKALIKRCYPDRDPTRNLGMVLLCSPFRVEGIKTDETAS